MLWETSPHTLIIYSLTCYVWVGCSVCQSTETKQNGMTMYFHQSAACTTEVVRVRTKSVHNARTFRRFVDGPINFHSCRNSTKKLRV
ncbi:hypothetical protein C8R48DRAFT_698106 [Suillus tomentosus]|nr:hypothetical protein C8R48DRAFT_698106 [Suillus tomentosus]